MHHDLKIFPQYFERVADGSKTFEVRENDRGFQVGDTVMLKERDPEKIMIRGFLSLVGPFPKGYTGRKLGPFRIGYVLPIDEKRVVFSLLREKDLF